MIWSMINSDHDETNHIYKVMNMRVEMPATAELVRKLEMLAHRMVCEKFDRYHVLHKDFVFYHIVNPNEEGWGTLEGFEDQIEWLTNY